MCEKIERMCERERNSVLESVGPTSFDHGRVHVFHHDTIITHRHQRESLPEFSHTLHSLQKENGE